LALLADRHEAGRDLVRDRPAENEAARLDAGNLVDLHPSPGLDQFVDRTAERACIAEQRGDVAEHDPGLGIVRDGADCVLEVVLELHADHGGLAVTRARDLQAGSLWRTMGRRATGDGICRDQPRRRWCRSSEAAPPACPARSGCTITAFTRGSSRRRMRWAGGRA